MGSKNPDSGNEPSGLDIEDRVDERLPAVPSIHGRMPGPQCALLPGLNMTSSPSVVGLDVHISFCGMSIGPVGTSMGGGKPRDDCDEAVVSRRGSGVGITRVSDGEGTRESSFSSPFDEDGRLENRLASFPWVDGTTVVVDAVPRICGRRAVPVSSGPRIVRPPMSSILPDGVICPSVTGETDDCSLCLLLPISIRVVPGLSLLSDCRRLTVFLTPSHSRTPCDLAGSTRDSLAPAADGSGEVGLLTPAFDVDEEVGDLPQNMETLRDRFSLVPLPPVADGGVSRSTSLGGSGSIKAIFGIGLGDLDGKGDETACPFLPLLGTGGGLSDTIGASPRPPGRPSPIGDVLELCCRGVRFALLDLDVERLRSDPSPLVKFGEDFSYRKVRCGLLGVTTMVLGISGGDSPGSGGGRGGRGRSRGIGGCSFSNESLEAKAKGRGGMEEERRGIEEAGRIKGAEILRGVVSKVGGMSSLSLSLAVLRNRRGKRVCLDQLSTHIYVLETDR